MSLTYGVAVLARPTFDVPFAEDMKNRAFAALGAAGIRTVGPRELLFDRAAAEKAVAEIQAAGPIDLLLILQITFTDATMTVKLAKEATTPIAIWAVPEPRIGGRLRLNAYCGLNLAAHALGRAGVPHGWLYAAPDAPDLAVSLRALATPAAVVPTRAQPVSAAADAKAEQVLESLRGAKITVVGKHPDGFDTCEYDEDLLFRLAGMRVENVQLGQLFDKARGMDAGRVGAARAGAAQELEGLEAVDQEQLDRSFRVFCALEEGLWIQPKAGDLYAQAAIVLASPALADEPDRLAAVELLSRRGMQFRQIAFWRGCDYWHLWGRASYLDLAGDQAGAAEMLQQAMAAGSDNAYFWLWSSAFFEKTGRIERGAFALSEAIGAGDRASESNGWRKLLRQKHADYLKRHNLSQ